MTSKNDLKLTCVRLERSNSVRLCFSDRNVAVAMTEVQLSHERRHELAPARYDVIIANRCRAEADEVAVDVTEQLVSVDVDVGRIGSTRDT